MIGLGVGPGPGIVGERVARVGLLVGVAPDGCLEATGAHVGSAVWGFLWEFFPLLFIFGW